MLPRKFEIRTLRSNFALLDVKLGRGPLFNRLGFSGKTVGEPVAVSIKGYIVGAWGDDDGISREFHVDVTGVEVLTNGHEIRQKKVSQGRCYDCGKDSGGGYRCQECRARVNIPRRNAAKRGNSRYETKGA